MNPVSPATIGVDTPFLVAHTVLEHPDHENAVNCRKILIERDRMFALCPTVVDEFIHVVTDPKRFEMPLTVARAIHIARVWINSQETICLNLTEASQRQQLDWMLELRLGRKRINDTRIASVYYSHGITKLLTANVRDYSVFGVFEIVEMNEPHP